MKINCVWEHNGDDTLLYISDFVGAFTRGESLEIALSKVEKEVSAYCRWRGEKAPDEIIPIVSQEKASTLAVCDADSDVIFDSERHPLTEKEYFELKRLVLKSAKDFLTMYESITDKHRSTLPQRSTFYGQRPRTAAEMYEHTKSVNKYYFGEIGVDADNDGTIVECRRKGFELLEKQRGFLANKVFEGSYDEEWSLRKVMRRFLWHDRIHAKAMLRMASKAFGGGVTDSFGFGS